MLRSAVGASQTSAVCQRRRLAAVLATSALAFAAATPGSATARERTVPHGFFGTFWGSDVRYSPADVRAREWDRMATSGVESVRTVFSWADAQPTGPSSVDFTETDAIVAEAVRRRISLLPVVTYAPAWARPPSSQSGQPPTNPSDYTHFLRLLVGRYGPHGSFWARRPDLPRRPLREWQIWNEPDLSPHWSNEDFAPGYGRLVRRSYRELKRADPGSRLVLAGLVNLSWDKLTRLYEDGGIKGYFDVAAVHTYTGYPGGVVIIARNFRHVMRVNGDARIPLYITEVSWSASQGIFEPPSELHFIQTDDRTLAARVAELYALMAAHRRRARTGVSRVYWYEWASSYTGESSVWDYVGLLRFDGATARPKPALRAYRRAARALEGCNKTALGACITPE
jgi:hypothetical protein